MRNEEGYLIRKKNADASDKCPGQMLCRNEIWIIDNMPYNSDIEKVMEAVKKWMEAHERSDWAVISLRCGKDHKWRLMLSIEEKYFNKKDRYTDIEHPYADIYAEIHDRRITL